MFDYWECQLGSRSVLGCFCLGGGAEDRGLNARKYDVCEIIPLRPGLGERRRL